MTLQVFNADLHIHTCLSPCADLHMGARAIVNRAAERGLRMISICDHNSSENAPAVIRAARHENLTVLPGMEVTSKEEVHILAVFDSVEKALELQELVYAHLPGEADAESSASQVVVNEEDEVVGFNRRWLAGATGLGVEQVVDSIHRLGGLAVASHVDRESFGIIGQLGFIPEDLDLDALEVSTHANWEELRRRFAPSGRFAFIRSSDAHCVKDIGCGFTSFLLGDPTTGEIRKALRGEDGRRVVGEGAAVCSFPPERPAFE